MVWGSFSFFGYTDLIIYHTNKDRCGINKGIDSKEYCNILNNNLGKLIDEHPIINNKRKAYFLQDNCPIHFSKYTIDFISKKQWKLIHHPKYSCDLNPIEKVWGRMKYIIKEKNQDGYETVEELAKAATDAWNIIMSDRNEREKYCKRYKIANLCCLYNRGDFCTDEKIREFKKISKI